MSSKSAVRSKSVSTTKSSSQKSPSRIKLGGAKPKPSSKGGLRVQEQQYVGIDLHRRRSVIVRMNDAGEVVKVSKIDNDPVTLAMAVAEAGPSPEVALEACYGWYWAADLLQAEGAKVHLIHPLGLHWDTRRVKNDVKDATELANRLRRNDVPEAWIAPPEVRELRELVRYRAKLVALRTSAKAQIHAVMAKLGILPPQAEMFGPSGQVLLDEMDFPGPYGLRVESLRDLLEIYDREIAMVEREIAGWLKDDPGYKAIQALHGIGPITAAILVAEIGERDWRDRPSASRIPGGGDSQGYLAARIHSVRAGWRCEPPRPESEPNGRIYPRIADESVQERRTERTCRSPKRRTEQCQARRRARWSSSASLPTGWTSLQPVADTHPAVGVLSPVRCRRGP